MSSNEDVGLGNDLHLHITGWVTVSRWKMVNPSETKASTKASRMFSKSEAKMFPHSPRSACVFQLTDAAWEACKSSEVCSGGRRNEGPSEHPSSSAVFPFARHSLFRNSLPPGKEKSQKHYITFGAQESFVAQETPDGPTPNPAWLWQRAYPTYGHHQVPLLCDKG